MYTDEEGVKQFAESPMWRLIIYLLGMIFAAALLVYQVRSLQKGQEEIQKELKLLTDPQTGLMVRFAEMKAALDLRVAQADREHSRYEMIMRDHESRIRAIELHRDGMIPGRMIDGRATP